MHCFTKKQHEIKLDLQQPLKSALSFVCDFRRALQRGRLRPGFRLVLWTFQRTIVAKIVFLNVSYLHTFVPFMYFYNFTVKIMAKVYVFYIKYLLIQSGKVRDICFDFLHWNNHPVIKVQLSTTNCYSLLLFYRVSMYKTKMGFNLFCFSVKNIYEDRLENVWLLNIC